MTRELPDAPAAATPTGLESPAAVHAGLAPHGAHIAASAAGAHRAAIAAVRLLASLAVCAAAVASLASPATAQPEWHRERTLPPAHRGAGACLDARGDVVLFGGETAAGLSDATWVFTPGVGWREQALAVRPAARSGHALAFDPLRGEVVLFGGGDGTTRLDDTWLFDGVAWRRASPTTRPTARHTCMAWDPIGARVLLFGGVDAGGNALDDTWSWSGRDWQQLAPVPHPPAARGVATWAMATDVQRGTIVLAGSARPSSLLADTWLWDGARWTQSASTGPTWRADHALAFVNGRTVLFGGWSYNGRPLDTWGFDGSQWQQLAPATSPGARAWHAFVAMPARGMSLLIGGGDAGLLFGDRWEFTGSEWRTPDGPDPGALLFPAIAYDPSGARTLLFGGDDAALGASSDATWQYRGGVWSRLAPAQRPPGRGRAAIAYDRARDELVLFGGAAGSTVFADTWVFAQGSWQQRTPATSPPARHGHALAFDEVRGTTVLFGGQRGFVNANFGDTWEWDGGAWRELADGASPSARRHHALAFDPVRGAVVLFGGFVDGVGFGDDTWQLRGGSWTPIATTTRATPRSLHGMTWDRARRCLVVFGGRSNAGWLADVWELGDDWRMRSPALDPRGREGPALVFDEAVGEVVLTSGRTSDSVVQADTWHFGVRPPARSEPFGSACRGNLAQAPVLWSDLPWLGAGVRISIDDVPSAAPAALWFGAARAHIPLEGLDMPGCIGWTWPFADAPATTNGTRADFALALPPVAAWIGVRLVVQGVVFAPGANPRGALVTNGLELTAALR